MIFNAVQINDEFFILTADGFRRFFQTQFDDCCCKEDISKGHSRRELAEERKSKNQIICCSRKEEREGLRLIGSQKDQRITE